MFIHTNQPLITSLYLKKIPIFVELAMSQRWSAIFYAMGAWGLMFRVGFRHGFFLFGFDQEFQKFGISLRSGFESPEKNFRNQKFYENPRDTPGYRIRYTGFINLVIKISYIWLFSGMRYPEKFRSD